MFRLHRDLYRIIYATSTGLYREIRRFLRSMSPTAGATSVCADGLALPRSKHWRADMSATLATIVRPAVAKRRERIRSDLSAPVVMGSRAISSVAPPLQPFASSTTAHCATSASRVPRSKRRSTASSLFPTKGGCDDGPHGTDGFHDPGRLCRRIPDLLHEGRVRWRILHRRHSAVVDRDGPGHRRRSARALVHRDGSVRAALLEALDVVEAGPCAAVAGARDRHRLRLSACSASSIIAPSRS